MSKTNKNSVIKRTSKIKFTGLNSSENSADKEMLLQNLQRDISLLMLNTEDAFVMVDLEMNIASFNLKFQEMYQDVFGIQVKLKDSIINYTLPERKEMLKALYHEVFKGFTQESEFAIENKVGKTLTYQIIYKPAIDEMGNIIGAFVNCRDITQIKESEAQIKYSEKKYRTLVENSGDAFAIINMEGKPTFVSSSVYKVLGYTEEEILKTDMYALLEPQDIEAVGKAMMDSLSKPGIPVKGHTSRMKHKDGTWRWIEATVTNLFHDPLINGFVDNFRDVTEKIELELEKEFERINTSALINSSIDLIWSVDKHYRLITANVTFINVIEGLTGMLLKSGDDVLLSGHFSDEFTNTWKNFYDRSFMGETFKEEVYTPEREKTNQSWSETSFNPIKQGNKIIGVACYGRDITLQKTINLSLEALSKSFTHLKGKEFYEQVCLHIANTLKVDHVFIGKLNNSKTSIEIKGGFSKGKKMKELSYRIKDTPSELVVSGKMQSYQEKLQEQFKKDKLLKEMEVQAYMGNPLINNKSEIFGVLVFMHGNAFLNYELAKSMIEIFSERISSEMQRTEQENFQIELNEKLIESQLKLQRITENVPTILYQLERSNKGFHYFPFVSKAIENAIEGIQIEKLYQDASSLFEKVHPEDLEEFLNSIKISKDNLESWEHEFRFLVNKDNYEWFKGSSKPELKVDGTVICYGYLQNVNHEVTAKKEERLNDDISKTLFQNPNLKESLTISLEKISKFFAFNLAEVWFVGRDNQSIYLKSTWAENEKLKKTMLPKNLKFTQKIGLSGTTWKRAKIQIFEDLEKHQEFTRNKEAKIAGIHAAISLPVILNNKVIAVLIFFKKSREKFNEQQIEFLQKLSVQIGIDIDRKKTTDELDQFFQYSPELISIVDRNGFFKRINPAFTKLLGYSDEELMSKHYSEFVHPDDRSNSNTVLTSNWKGAITNALINRYIAKDGTIKYIMWHSSEFLEEEGVIYGFGTDITALQQINIELLKYKNVIDNSQNGTFIYNFSDRSIIVNEALRNSYGFKPEENISLDEITEKFADENFKTIKNNIIQGNSWSSDVQIKNKNGVLKDYFLNIGSVVNEQKELIASYCIYTDISERKVFEEELLQYNYKITGILESINDGFFSLDKNMIVTYWNDKAETLLKTKREMIMGKNLWDIFDKNAAPKSYQYYTDVLNSREQIEFSEYFKPLDTWFEVNVYPSEEGISIFFKDITAFKKAHSEREKLLTTLERSLNEIYIFDVDSLKFKYLNEGAYKNIGYSKEEMLELTPLSIKPEHNLKSFQKLITPLKNKSKPKIVFETVHKRKDGSIYPVEVHLQLIQDWENDVFLAVILDISERRKTEMELRKLNESLNLRAEELAISNAELEQFAYVASHDMQEPLRMVTSFMTQLEKNYKAQLDDKAKLYIHYAVDGATRMRKIILDLLEYSRLGRKEAEIEHFNAEELLMEAIKLNKINIDEKNAIINWGKLPILKGNKAALLQVFQNLIGNALKYQKPDSQPIVQVNVNDKEKYWEFEVKDNGLGMEEKYFEKIFIIFQRLHNKEEFSGTGIGLAICKKIVENHGGKIWVNSEIGKGSSFFFTIAK